MDFKVGQKYKIVDIDAWWCKEKYVNGGEHPDGVREFNNLEAVKVELIYNILYFTCGDCHSQDIPSLINDEQWHDSCIELITDDIADVSKMGESDDTISLYHIADVLEDAVENYNWHDDDVEKFVDRVQECIKSLRKAGY